MIVRDLLDVLSQLDSHQKIRVIMKGLHTGDDGPACRFGDTQLPELARDNEGVVELRFTDE